MLPMEKPDLVNRIVLEFLQNEPGADDAADLAGAGAPAD